ncbi:MAG TPA: YciI family protein, partial [Blastocatellia bacterium]|nr:YciI family protein [Blastocatellia bacterium]
MQYILMIYAQESGWANLTAAQQQEAMAAYGSYTEALRQAGIFESSRRLQPSSTAKAVRVTNGKTQVTDGPYA